MSAEEMAWVDVAEVAGLVAERNQARQDAARMKTKLVAAVADLAEAREHLTKGVLLEAKREATRIGSPRALDVVLTTACRFGVTL